MKRIVSLVPSLSETLVKVGLRSELVGCTQFCVEPPDLYRTAKVIGGTKDFDLGLIRQLAPTHIVANQEENPKELIETLQREYPLLLTFPKSPFDVPAMLADMERFLGTNHLFSPWARQLEQKFQSLRKAAAPKRFLYFIWREPYMVVGRDTYISKLLECFGWENAYQGPERYPALSIDALIEADAEMLLLSTEPYPFRHRDAQRLRDQWVSCPEIYKIDGRMMSWFGTVSGEAWDWMQATADGRPLSPL